MAGGATRRLEDETEPSSASPGPAPDPFPEPLPSTGPNLASAVGWVLALLGFLIGARTIGDNSFLTHLATGRLILEEGSVPRVDPYSYLAAGEAWTVQSWLVSLLYAGLDGAFGPWAIRIVHGLVGIAIVRGVWRLTEASRQLLTRVALTSIVLIIGTFLWSPRPLLFGLLAMVVLLQVIHGLRSPWLLIPLFWLWVNSHGSFVLGAAALGLVAVGAAIDGRRTPWPEIRLVATAAIGCLASIISPLGWSLLWFPLHLMTRREALDRVSEWASPTFRSPIEQLFLLFLFVVVIGAARQAPWRAMLPSLLFFVAGLLAIRNLGLASLVIVAMMAPWLSGFAGSVDGAVTGFMPRALTTVAVTGFVVGSALVASGSALDLDSYPRDQIDWLEAHDLVAVPDVRLGQQDFVGNYLGYRYGRQARVFMDDRFDFHPLPIVKDHAEMVAGSRPGEVVERRAFDAVVWQTETVLGRWIADQPDWEIFADDGDWFVACRRTSELFVRCSS